MPVPVLPVVLDFHVIVLPLSRHVPLKLPGCSVDIACHVPSFLYVMLYGNDARWPCIVPVHEPTRPTTSDRVAVVDATSPCGGCGGGGATLTGFSACTALLR